MKKILIVDDAAFMRMMLRDILTKNGFEVVGEAKDGLEAVEQYNKLRPDLVTMDVTMPNMDGVQAVKAIRQLDPNAKIIMCSAMGQKSVVMDSVLAGAKDFIIKPFQTEKVLEAIEKIG